VQDDGVMIGRRLQRVTIFCQHLEPKVYLFKLAVGMDAELLHEAVALGARGVVIETFGGGRVPPWWLEAMQQAIDKGVAVAVTTRCPAGSLYDPYRYTGAYQDLVRVGCLLAHGLNGPKARLRLMVALGVTRDKEELQQLF
jgi:L-asparaginase